jgi:hypothetical protein
VYCKCKLAFLLEKEMQAEECPLCWFMGKEQVLRKACEQKILQVKQKRTSLCEGGVELNIGSKFWRVGRR